jgi:phosphatidylserine/phosphatidylglycerophosphate/cardiolipin synthase-like enzyme
MPLTSPVLQPAFQREADRLTRTAVRDGNSITFMPSGEMSYAKRWELIEGAQKSLHLVSFSVIKDETSRKLAGLVRDKVRQGVEVKFICDEGALWTTGARPILADMRKAGAEVITYDPLFRNFGIDWLKGHRFVRLMRRARRQLKRRFHEKFMVVDGSQAILGGMNWGTKYALGGESAKAWRDTDSYITGPVVADIQHRFLDSLFFYRAMEETWRRRWERGFDPQSVFDRVPELEAQAAEANAAAYFPPLPATGDTPIRYVGSKPYDEEFVPLTNEFLHLIRSANTSIWWGCHGVRPPRMFAETLADAAARGVEIHLISNSRTSSRSLMGHGLMGWMYWECSHYFRWLIERGIHVHLWQRPGAFHSKTMLVDDAVVGIGSYNLANGSTYHHTESTVFVHGGDFAAQVKNQFLIDLKDCTELTLAEANTPPRWADPFRRPLHERNLLVDRSLWPEAVKADLDAGRFTWKYSDPPT